MKNEKGPLQVNGFIALTGEDIMKNRLPKAIESISRRAWNNQMIIVPGCEIMRNTRQLDFEKSNAYMICCGTTETVNHNSTILHGKIYHPTEKEVQESLSESLIEGKIMNVTNNLSQIDGNYTIAAVNNDRIICARDPLGTKPLYISKNKSFTGVSTEAKALSILGCEKIERIPPGYLYHITPSKIQVTRFRNVKRRFSKINENEAPKKILSFLEESIKRRVMGLKKIAIGFSGGLDSSLLAHIASRFVEVNLVSIYSPGSRDEVIPCEAANRLNLNIEMVKVEYEDVAIMIPELIHILETDAKMDLSTGLGIYLASQKAQELGMEGIMLGQLADELFGGYAKYIRNMIHGEKYVNEMLLNDVLKGYKNNFERDEKAVSSFTIPILPYAAIDLVEYGLSIPLHLKIDSQNQIRKKVLREAAIISGLPKKLALEPKKALQYSTGLHKLIIKGLKQTQITNPYIVSDYQI